MVQGLRQASVSKSICTVDFDSWANTAPAPVVPASTSRKKKVAPRNVHPLFTQCAAICPDPFWAEKLTNAGNGKFPAKFSFNEGVLVHKKGNKTNSVELSLDPEEAMPAFMEFMRTHAGIFSPGDEQASRELAQQRTNAVLTQPPLTWADANKKVQEQLLSYFVLDMKAVMQLTNVEMEQLRQTVKVGIANKCLGAHNIIVNEQRIQQIPGLCWDSKIREFSLDSALEDSVKVTRRTSKKKTATDAVKDTVPQFPVKWSKYLESLEKKAIKLSRREQRVERNQAYRSIESSMAEEETDGEEEESG